MSTFSLMSSVLLSPSAEDILDEVSGLTVNSPDESLEEGPSPGGHQEDKTFTGTGQKVGRGMQKRNFEMQTH